MIDKNELIKLLEEGEVTVTFRKKHVNEIRVMHCTKNPDFIPLEDLPKGNFKKIAPDYIVCAYDLDKEDWRSFDIDLVIDVTYE
jgi:hypothetical protein